VAKRLLLISIAIITLIVACSGTNSNGGSDEPDTQSLTIFAASSLTEAFSELGDIFEAEHPGSQVTLNFAGSQQLAQQLAQGAPGDVFASANRKQMQTAIDSDRIEDANAKIMIGNRIVIIFSLDDLGGVRRIADLARPELRLVLGSENVPIGAYSLEFLEKASQDPAFGPEFKENVLNNVVSYEQNVRAVLNKVTLGEADAGIVFESDLSESDSVKIGALRIPPALNVNASYYIAPTNDAANPGLAAAFIDLVISLEGQDILAKYGFIPVY
jgi:molybdate transport system substrate-binding protein